MNNLHVFKLNDRDGLSPMEYWDQAIKDQVKVAADNGIQHVTSWSWYGHNVGGPMYLLLLVNPSQYFIDQIKLRADIVDGAVETFNDNPPIGFKIKTQIVCTQEPIYPELAIDEDGVPIIPEVTPQPIAFRDVPIGETPSEEVVYYGEEI